MKDLIGWVGFAILFSVFVYFYPNALGHPDNYIPANPMSTPAHIVPEWYFLWVYAILRSIPNKLGGVAAIALVFVALLALPFINTTQVRSSTFRPIHRKLFWLLVADCISVYFFVYLLVLLPFLGKFEELLIHYKNPLLHNQDIQPLSVAR